MKKMNKKGFTLVELMVVVIIVGILAAVAVPLMSANRDKAIASEAISAIGSINTAAKLYVVEKGYDSGAPAVTDLESAGFLDATELEGAYFDASEFDSLGTVDNAAGNCYVVDTVTVTDKDGQTHTITKDANDRYSRTGD